MADLILPDEAHANDPGHITDHNQIVTAIQTVNTAVEAVETELGSNPSGTYSTVAARLAAVESSGANKDSLYTPLGTPVWADEFTSATLDPAWVRADYTGDAGHLQWIYGSGVLAAQHTNAADAVGGRMHCLLRTVESAGGPFVPGDALVSAWVTANTYATNYTMVGVGATNGTTFGTSNIVQTQSYTNSGAASPGQFRINTNPGMNSDGANAGISLGSFTPLFARFVMTATNTWRSDYSADGVGWVAGPAPVSYSLTPTHIGFFVTNWTTAVPFAASFKFIRRYAGVT